MALVGARVVKGSAAECPTSQKLQRGNDDVITPGSDDGPVGSALGVRRLPQL